jgi:hypothetical protein
VFDLVGRKAAHWAWQPVRVVAPPALNDGAWARGQIDRYILAALEAKGLTPAGDADRRALIRRATFDLIGLPPTPGEVREFLEDGSADAWPKVIDRLLASPHFGERWARHWMDLVRYAETYGHEFDYPIASAWQYRDYLIRAFNADVPYDRFVSEHIAGDLLASPRRNPTEGYNESIIGTGFWWFGEQVQAPVDVRQHQAERLDNQIDVMGKTFLALTLGCARCHDHKFDAISQKDVYGLWGFVEGTRWQQAMLDPKGKMHEAAMKLGALRKKGTSLIFSERPSERQRSVLPASGPSSNEVSFKDFADGNFDGWYVSGEAFGERPARVGEWDSFAGSRAVQIGAAHSGMLGRRLQGVLRSPDFVIAQDVIWYYAAGMGGKLRLVVDGYRVNEFNALLFAGHLMEVKQEAFGWIKQATDVGRYKGHLAHIEIIDDGDGWVAVNQIRFSDRTVAPPVPQGVSAEAAPGPVVAELLKLRNSMREIEAAIPTPMRVVAAEDGSGVDEHIYIRGSPHNLGEVAPRRFLEAIAGPDQPPVGKGCGRLELARRMTDPSNPLLARVMVNRLWHYLFGRGIVPSTDNFGVLGSPPSHPELLDYLADRFVKDGWSIKRAIREMMLSRTYQMASSASDAKAEEADPANVLLHRASVRRLEGEAIRDAMLTVSGRMDPAMFGPPVEVYLTPFMEGRGKPGGSGPLDGAGRRSIYTAVRRNFLPPMMLAFDTPMPFSTMGRRSVSNVPAQALILMNDPFVIDQARLWAKRVLAEPGKTSRQRIDAMYQAAFGRPASETEVQRGMAFLAEPGEGAWAEYAQVLMNTKEFIFLN